MLFPLISRYLLLLAVAVPHKAKASEPIPETDIGRIVVDFTSLDPDRHWIARAHEFNVLNMFKDSPRLLSVAKDSLQLANCPDFPCRRRVLKDAGIDLYIEGEVTVDTLRYRALIPETEQILSEGGISIAPNTAPEHVKTAFLHAMKPFTESGGILDQRAALRRAEKAAAENGPKVARQAMGLALGALAFLVLAVIFASLFYFQHGRRYLLIIGAAWIFFALGPLWLISEDLALVKPIAIFAIPDPWVLAVIGGLGAGWALWGLGLCVLPQLRGLETLKQNRMPHVVDALMTVFFYRAIATLLWIGVAAGLVLGAREIFGLDKVHSVALGLMVFGGLATLSALVFELIAQALDRKFISGQPNASNPWHSRIVEALAGHPLLADLEDLAAHAYYLPTEQNRPLTYGGGLSRPRVLIPRAALEKAFNTRPEDNGLAYDFLAGLVLDALGRVSLRTHLEATLRLGQELKESSPGKIRGFLFDPYRRARRLLEGCFITVHDGLGPFIQYLYWRHNPQSELLTVSASPSQLIAITRLILGRVQTQDRPKSIDTPSDHICWLVQNFLYSAPTEDFSTRKRGRIKPRTAVIIALMVFFTGYQLVAAVLYHSVYEERIASQQARIEEKKKKKEIEKEGLAHAVGESPAPVVQSTAPATPEVVPKAAPKKQRVGTGKSKPAKRKKASRPR
ncbi:hypothetical protein [Oligoflexus tunisiensis]|uniref:hypothetical protein n=1 Tax=Oligoflexus tunisiensis TaxID=708132 RepID=UPI00159F28F1|nr:hypothetical protein [Oligoflexus tunisiensis]